MSTVLWALVIPVVDAIKMFSEVLLLLTIVFVDDPRHHPLVYIFVLFTCSNVIDAIAIRYYYNEFKRGKSMYECVENAYQTMIWSLIPNKHFENVSKTEIQRIFYQKALIDAANKK